MAWAIAQNYLFFFYTNRIYINSEMEQDDSHDKDSHDKYFVYSILKYQMYAIPRFFSIPVQR